MVRALFIAVVLATTLPVCGTPPAGPDGSSLALADVITGARQRPLAGAAGDVVVVVFSSTDCPIANALAPELERIHLDTAGRGGRLYLVHPRADLGPAAAATHARDYGLTMPVLIDHDLALTRSLGAGVTPEAAVLRFTASGHWALVYRGRVNDLYVALGKRRAAAGSHDLRRAIDAALAGRPIDFEPVRAVGCLIEGT